MTDTTSARSGQGKIARRLALLAPVFVVSLGLAVTAAVDWQDGTPTLASAHAKGGGNGGGNGNGANGGHGKGPGDAPGQTRDEDVSDDFGSDQAEADAEGAVAGTVDNGRDEVDTRLPEIAEDPAPASIRVIKELAGLPEESALSEEEELEAIRNGWGTWRTADGPDTILAQ